MADCCVCWLSSVSFCQHEATRDTLMLQTWHTYLLHILLLMLQFNTIISRTCAASFLHICPCHVFSSCSFHSDLLTNVYISLSQIFVYFCSFQSTKAEDSFRTAANDYFHYWIICWSFYWLIVWSINIRTHQNTSQSPQVTSWVYESKNTCFMSVFRFEL